MPESMSYLHKNNFLSNTEGRGKKDTPVTDLYVTLGTGLLSGDFIKNRTIKDGKDLEFPTTVF